MAWKWTLAVTEDKAVRSFSTVLELMRLYPEYKFMSSQPQLYKYVKKNAPQVYEEIKERVKEGRWETEGGMFLEADCNLTSGESLVRQFLYASAFFGRSSERTMRFSGFRMYSATRLLCRDYEKMWHPLFYDDEDQLE